MENSYLSIALNDYEYALVSRHPGFNNNIVAQYQQVCEKLLKHVVEHVGTNSDLLRSHNLKRLYDSVKSEVHLSRESELYLSTLTDFYFDARYPGDDFLNVSDEDTDYSYKVMVEVHDKVLEWENKRQSNKPVDKLVEGMKHGDGND